MDTLFNLPVAVAIVVLYFGVLLLPEPHADLLPNADEDLTCGPCTFDVSEGARTLVGAFQSTSPRLIAVVTTYPNHTVHSPPTPLRSCGGCLNLSLPSGQDYIDFPLGGGL